MRPSKSNRKARTCTGGQSTRVAILGVDVGGTFTDAVLVEEGRIRTAKVPTAARQEKSVIAAARAVGAGDGVARFAHGTTVATNALLARRGARTAYDAYLAPGAARYLRALAAAAAEAGLPEPVVMLSSGGVVPAKEAAAHPARLLVSGPAGGVVGAGLVARRAGFEDAIAFDMGGTSTDVCLLPGGRAVRVPEREVGGLPVRLPSVDVHTVGAGGGSLVRRDAGGALRVGPESAGADPGPACYGRGGGPTVTDANLLLDRLPGELPGGLVLDRNAAAAALDGIDPAAVVEVVNAEMLRALRVVSVERGHDPREFALVAYGGAGPLHACALAEEVGVEAVLVPAAAGVLSALGLAAGDERRDPVGAHVPPRRAVRVR